MSRALLQAWERTLRRRPDNRAIIQAVDGRVATFRELDTAARTLAASFDSRALAGRAVVFALPNGIRWLELFLALIRSGAVAVPLDSGEPPAAQKRTAEMLRAGCWWDGTRLVALPNPRRFRDSELSVVKLTSGSTGVPRALVFTGAQILADGRQVARTMGIRDTDLNYALIPFGHSYGLGNLTLPLIAQGVPVVCGAAPLPHAVAGDFARWCPTVFPSVPAVFRALVATDIDPKALASLRVAISAGAPLLPETAQSFLRQFGHRIHAFYGSSETGGITYDVSGAAALSGSVGTAMRGVRLSLERGGRLRVCSTAVFTFGNRNIRRGIGCWSPPDRASMDSRGRITLLGRTGATVKIAGRRVNLAEITARLRRLPGVRDAWVGVSAAAEPALGAAVVTSRSQAELRADLLADTAAWKIPKRWLVLDDFPLTQRGKTDTGVLQLRVFGPG